MIHVRRAARPSHTPLGQFFNNLFSFLSLSRCSVPTLTNHWLIGKTVDKPAARALLPSRPPGPTSRDGLHGRTLRCARGHCPFISSLLLLARHHRHDLTLCCFPACAVSQANRAAGPSRRLPLGRVGASSHLHDALRAASPSGRAPAAMNWTCMTWHAYHPVVRQPSLQSMGDSRAELARAVAEDPLRCRPRRAPSPVKPQTTSLGSPQQHGAKRGPSTCRPAKPNRLRS